MSRDLFKRERAQAIGILRLFLSLIFGAFIYWIVRIASNNLLPVARNASADQTSSQGTVWIEQGISFLPLFFLFLGFFGLIALAVFQRRGGP
jgi:hypothetical protein